MQFETFYEFTQTLLLVMLYIYCIQHRNKISKALDVDYN